MAITKATEISGAGSHPSQRLGARERKVVEVAEQFAPDEEDDWTTPPSTISAALDELAQRVTDGPYTPGEETDWDTPPTSIAAALDELAARVKVLEPG